MLCVPIAARIEALHDVAVLVRRARGGEAGDRVGPAVAVADPRDLADDARDRLVPRRGAQLAAARVADERRAQPVALAREAVREAALQARVAVVGGAVERRADRHDAAVDGVRLQAAADAAVAAGRADVAIKSLGVMAIAAYLRSAIASREISVIASVGHVSAQAPHDTQVDSRKPWSSRRRCSREAAAGGGQRERALDLVAGAHAAPAGDAQLVLQREVGMALVVQARVLLAAASAARRDRAPNQAARDRELGVRGRARPAARRARARRSPRRSRRAVGVARVDAIPSRQSVVQAATGPAAPSTPTMQTRQAPNGSWRSSKQSVGTAPPSRADGFEHGRAGRDLGRGAVDLDLMVVMRVRVPPQSVPTGCEWVRASPPPWAHSEPSSSVSSSASSRARSTGALAGEHLVRAAQPDPAGKALAAALGGAEVQQVRGERPHVGRFVEGDDPAVAEHAADRLELLEIERRVELRRGQDAAQRAADLQRLDRVAVDEAAGDVLAQLAHRRAEGHLVDARPREALVEAHELGARGRAVGAERRVERRARARHERDVAQRLDVVDDRRQAVQPALGGKRRPRGDRPAQALQAGEQRRLLADDVGARAFDDRDVEGEVRCRGRRRRAWPSRCAWATAASSAGLERGYSERVSTKPWSAPTA